MLKNLTTKFLNKQKCYRLIPSKFPPIALFEDVADEQDFEAVYAIQALTNPRILHELGDLTLVPAQDRIYSIKGSGYIMAAFTHLNPQGSRFSDGTFGIYYASEDLKTAIKETVYHRNLFMAATNEPAQELDMRCLVANFSADLIDIDYNFYKQDKFYSSIYALDNYQESQSFGIRLKKDQHDGIYYHSVRAEKGINFALFKPKLFHDCIQQSHYGYVWNGKEIVEIYRKTKIQC